MVACGKGFCDFRIPFRVQAPKLVTIIDKLTKIESKMIYSSFHAKKLSCFLNG